MRGFRVKALGEVAIRCADMAPMYAFYHNVIGLDVLSGGPGDDIVFFRIGPGHGGHTTVLALFTRDAGRAAIHPHGIEPPITGAQSSLHHIALTVDYAEQDAVMAWYDAQGLDYSVQHFGWIGWRGVFTRDPEGNTVELVAYDATLLESSQHTP